MTNYKLNIYDDFKCSAGECHMSCCRGWDIAVDKETYQKWKFDQKRKLPFLKSIEPKDGEKDAFRIKTGKEKICPFLDEQGLCRIYINYGEDFLPAICDTFPRFVNEYENRTEYALSLACPVTHEILWNLDKTVELVPAQDTEVKNIGGEKVLDSAEGAASEREESDTFILRCRLLDILCDTALPVNARLYLGFVMLHQADELINAPQQEESDWEEILQSEEMQEILSEYDTSEKRQEWYTQEWMVHKEADLEKRFTELAELFVDITLLYKEEKFYAPYIRPVLDALESLAGFSEEKQPEKEAAEATDDQQNKEDGIIKVMSIMQKLMEESACEKYLTNVLLSSIYHDCVGDIVEYEMVLLSYLLTFLAVSTYFMNRDSVQNVSIIYTIFRDYHCLFSRIISHNTGAVQEFLEESFGDLVWDEAYAHLLLK